MATVWMCGGSPPPAKPYRHPEAAPARATSSATLRPTPRLGIKRLHLCHRIYREAEARFFPREIQLGRDYLRSGFVEARFGETHDTPAATHFRQQPDRLFPYLDEIKRVARAGVAPRAMLRRIQR